MKRGHILIGLNNSDLHEVANILRDMAGDSFRFRDSEITGPGYLTFDAKYPQFELYPNLTEDEDGQYLRKPKYPKYPLILAVYGYEIGDNLKVRILESTELQAALLEEI